jgi:GDP-L-fucose synthase
MKILVTGATGFVGKTLCAGLAEQGHELAKVSSRNCDLTVAESLNMFNDCRYDQIYHLAAWTRAGDFCLKHPGEQWIVNQKINTNVLAWWQARQSQAKLICLGTSLAYSADFELVETNYLEGSPGQNHYAYAMTKRMLQVGLLALHQQFGPKYLCLVPSTVYGPGYHTDGRPMHFIFDLIRKILRAQSRGEPVVLWGDGYQTRDLIYVDDLVRITVELAARLDDDLINVSSGESFSIRQFARSICALTGYDFNAIQFDAAHPAGNPSRCLSISKLKGILPDLRFTSLETGLDRTIEWFRLEGQPLL